MSEIAKQDGIDLLIIVSTPGAVKVFLPLAGACKRRGLRWTCFFTNDGVRVLEDANALRAIRWADDPIACEHSWARFEGEAACPIELGSQTDNSALVGRAGKVIGL